MTNLIIGPKVGAHTATLIFLHGLGDTGQGWSAAMRHIAASLPSWRFILPTAPTRPVSLNWGMRMPAWYDILSLEEGDRREDYQGMLQSVSTLSELARQQQGPVYIGGFSQGAVVALLTAALHPELAAGVVSLSGYAPHLLQEALSKKEQKHLPSLFVAHGIYDELVKIKWSRDTAHLLRPHCTFMVHKEYPMGHEACEQELADVIAFLANKKQQ